MSKIERRRPPQQRRPARRAGDRNAPLRTTRMLPLMERTAGIPEVVVGIVDGPVLPSHPGLRQVRLRSISATAAEGCRLSESPACRHGTFIAGILAARRGSPAPAICPQCTLLTRSVFCEAPASKQSCPEATPRELGAAIAETVRAGAWVVNLSIGFSGAAMPDHPDLAAAFELAFRKGVLVVAATGNQGRVGRPPLSAHPWVIPVAACNPWGGPEPNSNLGPSVGRRGLLAPGSGVTSTCSSGGYSEMAGTSVAAPFVTGAIALLWSLHPGAAAAQIRRAILQSGPRRSITPPLLNAEASWRQINERLNSVRRNHGRARSN